LKRAPVWHVPMWEGDYQGFLKQPTLFEIYSAVGYAEGEKKLLWDLPGHGEAYFDCGTVKAKGCDNIQAHQDHDSMVFVRYFKRSCRRKKCPTCYEAWATAEAERALIRFSAFILGSRVVDRLILRAKQKFRKEPREIFHKKLVRKLETKIKKVLRHKPIHVVFSPPEGLIDDTIEGHKKGKALAYQLAREHGLYGGACVFHPYRLKCSSCGSAIPDYHKKCPDCGKEDFSWFWSPHFHMVGFGWIHHTAEGYQKHGWVIKNLGLRKSVFFTFQYLLSHAGVSRPHTTTWFGKLAYRMLRAPVLGAVPEICPICGAPLRPLVWLGGEDRGPPDMEILKDPYLNQFLAKYKDWRTR
jgi:hypothetical protein